MKIRSQQYIQLNTFCKCTSIIKLWYDLFLLGHAPGLITWVVVPYFYARFRDRLRYKLEKLIWVGGPILIVVQM